MSALEAYEHKQPTKIEPVTPGGQEGRDAEIIPFPIKAGVGEVAVGVFAGANERENALNLAVLADRGIAVRQGSGSNRYFTRRMRTPSAAPYSQEYNMRARELSDRTDFINS